MPVFGNTGGYIATGSDGVNVPAVTVGIEAQWWTKVVGNFATLAARDAAYSSLTLLNRRGILCWVDETKGHYSHDGTGWRPLGLNHEILDGSRAAAADSTGPTTSDIILGSSITLPAGNRRLMIIASSNVTALTNIGSFPRVIVAGPGISATEGYMQSAALPFAGAAATVSRVWRPVVSGTVAYTMRGMDGHPTAPAAVRFTDSILHVTDLGTAD